MLKENKNGSTVGYFIALMILAVVSAVTSGVGLWTIFSKSSNEYLAVLFAVMITGALQLFIVISWRTSFRDFGFGIKALSLGAGFFLAALSGLLASGSYNFMFNGAAYQTYLNIQEKYKVEKPVLEIQNYLDDFSGMMIDFANESKSLALIESTSGGTCDGDAPQVGEGPRTRLRNRFSDETRVKANEASSVVREFDSVLGQIRRAVTDDDYIRSYSAARKLLKDHRIRGIERWLGNAKTNFGSSNAWFDTEINRNFDCRDQSFVVVIDDALRILSASPELPTKPPAPQVFSFRESLFKSYQDAFSLLLEYIGAKSKPVLEGLIEQRKYSYIGYFCGFFVEFLIFWVSLIIASLDKRSGRQINTLDMVLNGGRKRDQQEKDILTNVLRSDKGELNEAVNFILELIYPIHKNKYLLVPVDGKPSARAAAKRYAALLKLKCDKRELHHWPIDKLEAKFVGSRSEIFESVSLVDLYPVSSDALNQIENLLRDAALDGREESKPIPSEPDPEPETETDETPFDDDESSAENVVNISRPTA